MSALNPFSLDAIRTGTGRRLDPHRAPFLQIHGACPIPWYLIADQKGAVDTARLRVLRGQFRIQFWSGTFGKKVCSEFRRPEWKSHVHAGGAGKRARFVN